MQDSRIMPEGYEGATDAAVSIAIIIYLAEILGTDVSFWQML